jgi:two-component system, cell cycle sensor histidine kinase and response regulator CckA
MKKLKISYSGLTASKIAGIYLLVGTFWILLSDTLLGWFLQISPTYYKVQIAKGCIFVLITGWMLYLLVRRSIGEQHKIQESVARLAAIVESSDDAIISQTTDGIITSWNKGAQQIYGYSAKEIVGQSIVILSPEERHEEIRQILESIREGKSLEYFETVRLNKEGQRIDVSLTISPIRNSEGQITGASTIGRDVTERKRMEEALKQSEQDYHGLFDNAHDALLILSPEDEIVLDVNQRACEIYGFSKSEFVGMSLESLTKDVARGKEQIQRTLEKREFHSFETVQRRKDGSEIFLETNGAVVNYKGQEALLSINRDITERKLLEDQFRQSQKMEAVGRLAGGIAHDFNNLLTAIIGYSQLALRGIDADNPLHNNFEEIEKAGKRAAVLTNKMLAFSRKQVIQPKILNLNSSIADIEKMLRRLIGEDIEIAMFLSDKLWMVKADLGQFEQVLMNLVVNARDAMPQGGKLTIETSNVSLDETYARHHLNVTPGDYMMLAVSDTGIGMDAATLSHIFEPFFTTKEAGKGTGLGLSTVYGIVNQNNGHIWVYSEPGHGTTFKVYLPRVKGGVESVEQAENPADSVQGKETLMVVEDEDAVRNLVCQILRSRGYKVLEASHGVDALLLLEQQSEPIHLIITDVIMPFMSGREFADKAIHKYKDIKVLFMSGYTDEAILPHGVLDPGVAFIQKPFTTATLAVKVRDLLDDPSTKRD